MSRFPVGSSRDETEGAFGDCCGARVTWGADAITANFIDGGTVKAPTVKAPPVTLASMLAATTKKMVAAVKDPKATAAASAAAADARRRELSAQAGRTAAINAPYQAQRAADTRAANIRDAECKARRGAECKYLWDTSVDLGLIPMGIKVLGTGAAIVATGGALIGPVGLTAGAGLTASGVLSSAVAADKLLADAADAGKKGKAALETINNTVSLATGGKVDAKIGLNTLAAVATDRIAKNIAPGVTQSASQVASALNRASAATFDGKAAQIAAAIKKPGAVKAAAASPDVKAKVAARVASVDFPASVVRWTVSDAGRIVSGLGSGKGWVVYDSGAVQRKAS